MKKILILFFTIAFLFILNIPPAWSFSSVSYSFTTDFLELLDKDYQGEFMIVAGFRSAYAVRIGYYQYLEDSTEKYSGDKRHWELGFRWRNFLMEAAPHLISLGVGFDTRPEDNIVTPTGEIGFNLCPEPITIGIIGFVGHEIDWKNSDKNRWVKGVELRVGFCF
ncbi:MAG: hypothetical protein IBX60_01350 [Candidatus Aminicenantes bacterium]|nr:hypothetical protein [Candidatus Aminicenantes bacterium]